MKWIWIILALLYLISPYDIISGLHLPGWIDDIVVMGFLFRYLLKLRNPTAAGGSPRNDDQSAHQQSASNNSTSDEQIRSPHEILGISQNADQKEVQAAYRKLANQCHPDKVAHLGEEFHTMAEKRFKEIQKAYDELRR